jgi:hypothetical protein
LVKVQMVLLAAEALAMTVGVGQVEHPVAAGIPVYMAAAVALFSPVLVSVTVQEALSE